MLLLSHQGVYFKPKWEALAKNIKTGKPTETKSPLIAKGHEQSCNSKLPKKGAQAYFVLSHHRCSSICLSKDGKFILHQLKPEQRIRKVVYLCKQSLCCSKYISFRRPSVGFKKIFFLQDHSSAWCQLEMAIRHVFFLESPLMAIWYMYRRLLEGSRKQVMDR